MFEYFPKNYTWSFSAVRAIDLSGAVSEVEEACRTLKEVSLRSDLTAQEAWHNSWRKLADKVAGFAADNERAGQLLSAGRKYRRANIYYSMAERMLPHPHQWRENSFGKALAAFDKAVEYGREPVERVRVPFGDSYIPALFSKAAGNGPAPCMVHFNGFDAVKEWCYFLSAAEFRRRGISALYIDQPGTGEALVSLKLYGRADTEVPAGACVDYLRTRRDVDPERIGVVGISLGGYYAPRAAAFEKRFKCCVAWGANHNFGERSKLRLAGTGGEMAQPDYANRLMWVFGKNTVADALATAKGLTLEGVADKITCPLLVVHGENDHIIPLWEAQKTFDAAVNSPNRKLKVFTIAEGGEDHCQLDNIQLGVDYIADWVAETLGGNLRGV